MISLPDRLDRELGELDDPLVFSRKREVAWSAYLVIAAEVQPEVLNTLLTPEVIAHGNTDRQEIRPEDGEEIRAVRDQHVSEWAELWGFLNHFARIPAVNTIAAASRARVEELPLPVTFVCDVHGHPLWDDGSLAYKRIISARMWVQNPDLHDEPIEIGRGEPLWLDFGDVFWDPLRETLVHARMRILNDLELEVSAELERIRDDYVEAGYKPVSAKTALIQHLEWLARVRLKDETVASVVRSLKGDDESRSRRTVDRALRAAEELLGIEHWKGKPGPRFISTP